MTALTGAPHILGASERDELPPKWQNGEDCAKYLEGCLERLRLSRDAVSMVLHHTGDRGSAELQRTAYSRYTLNLGATLAAVATAYQAGFIPADRFHAIRNAAVQTAVQSLVGSVVV